jgi:hypothetical protein
VRDREYVRTETVVDGQRQWVTTEKPRVGLPSKLEELLDPAKLVALLQLQGRIRQTVKGPVLFINAKGVSGSKRADGTRWFSEVIGTVRYVRITDPTTGQVRNTLAIDGYRPKPLVPVAVGTGSEAKAGEAPKPAVETADPVVAAMAPVEVEGDDLPPDLDI